MSKYIPRYNTQNQSYVGDTQISETLTWSYQKENPEKKIRNINLDGWWYFITDI